MIAKLYDAKQLCPCDDRQSSIQYNDRDCRYADQKIAHSCDLRGQYHVECRGKKDLRSRYEKPEPAAFRAVIAQEYDHQHKGNDRQPQEQTALYCFGERHEITHLQPLPYTA